MNQLNDNERLVYQYENLTIIISTIVDDIYNDKNIKALKIFVKDNDSFINKSEFLIPKKD